MRFSVLILLVLMLAAVPVAAQKVVVQIRNVSRPASSDFQIGDKFEIVIHGPSDQPVSVRTTIQGRTDWGPVIGRTDSEGRWSTSGQFEKADFGSWTEAWTVGGKLAEPTVQFLVSAPCLKEGQHGILATGLPMSETCETSEGQQSFVTLSNTESFRTPDGRTVPGRGSNMTAEEYQTEMMESRITSGTGGGQPRQFGDEAAALITKIIGVNALNETETLNVLAIVHAAFENPERLSPITREPVATLPLLRSLADATDSASLKEQIAETVAFVE